MTPWLDTTGHDVYAYGLMARTTMVMAVDHKLQACEFMGVAGKYAHVPGDLQISGSLVPAASRAMPARAELSVGLTQGTVEKNFVLPLEYARVSTGTLRGQVRYLSDARDVYEVFLPGCDLTARMGDVELAVEASDHDARNLAVAVLLELALSRPRAYIAPDVDQDAAWLRAAGRCQRSGRCDQFFALFGTLDQVGPHGNP